MVVRIARSPFNLARRRFVSLIYLRTYITASAVRWHVGYTDAVYMPNRPELR